MSKNISAGLKALLLSGEYFQADLYEMTLQTGTVIRATSGDRDIVFSGATYSAGGFTGPFFATAENRPKLSFRVGLDVDTMVFDVDPGDAQIAGFTWAQAAMFGILDSARLTVRRACMPTYGDTSLGCPVMFFGKVGHVDPKGTTVSMMVNGISAELSTQLPKNLYSPTCINMLFDAACTVNMENFAQNGTVTTGTTASTIVATITAAKADDTYSLGHIRITSGQLAGMNYPVRKYIQSPPTFSLARPTPIVLANGTTFRAYFGCNKILNDANGCAKFANQANYRGHNHVPNPRIAQ